MSMNLANQTLDFIKALLASDPEKVYSVLMSVIQMDEYIEEPIKKQRMEELLLAYQMVR